MKIKSLKKNTIANNKLLIVCVPFRKVKKNLNVYMFNTCNYVCNYWDSKLSVQVV